MDVRAAAASTSGAVDQPSAEGQRAQLARLAHEFEAMFLSEMLRGMRQSMLSDDQEQGLGNETMTDTFDGELGLSLSRSGGLGLATIMLDALNKRGLDGSSAAGTNAGAPDSSVGSDISTASGDSSMTMALTTFKDLPAAPASVTATPAVLPSATRPGPVSSPFGWRADPFTGRPQFHAGTDVKLAYGHGVEAVAAGRVSSVGERSGYGLTVVIDHGNGLETRYAHLSGASVREGDLVQAGQVVAQSGNSGRSTGPHLHLEARLDGRAIDVATLLKDSGSIADSYADGSHVRSGQ